MIKALLNHGGNVSTDANGERQNILHMLAAQCMEYDTVRLIDTFLVTPHFSERCRIYSRLKRKHSKHSSEECSML